MSILTKLGFVHPWIAIPMMIIETIGTVIRPPFTFLVKRSDPVRVVRATFVGKIKTLLQSMGCLLCGPVYLGWYKSTFALNLLFGLGLFAAVISILSRLRTSPAVHRILNRVGGKLFSHKDVL